MSLVIDLEFMKNKKTWLAILIMVFGMTVVGCDETPPEDNYEYDNRPDLFGWFAELDNYYPVVGETITASLVKGYSSSPITDPNGTASWRWYKTSEDSLSLYAVTNKETIGYGKTYTVRQADVGSWLWAEVSYSGNSGTQETRTSSIVIGIPATATVSVSISAVYYPTSSFSNHEVTVTLSLSDGRWNNVTYSTASEWIAMSGIPLVSLLFPNPSISAYGHDLVFSYRTRSETIFPINNLTVALVSSQLSTMRSNTNVYNTLTVGTPSTASVSQWDIR